MINVLVADDSALLRRIDCDIINNIEGFSVADIAFDEASIMNKLKEKLYDVLVMNVSLDSKGSGHFMDAFKAMKNEASIVAISYPLFEDKNLVSRYYSDAAGLVVRPFHMSVEEREEYRKKLTHAVMNAAGRVMPVQAPPKNAGTQDGNTLNTAHGSQDGNAAPGTQNINTDRGAQKTGTQNGNNNLFSSQIKPTIRNAVNIAKNRKPVSNGPYQLLMIACSTGGPQALHKVVPKITKALPVPVVIVQHMPYGFTAPLAERLSEKSVVKAKEAEEGELLRKNMIYIAPGGRHLEIVNDPSGALKAHVYDGPQVNSLKPCADVTFRSVRKCNVNNILCVVLTGMGMDATTGIAELSTVKNIYVISQDEQSSVVYGMPKAVKEAGLSNEVEPLSNIAESIMRKLGV